MLILAGPFLIWSGIHSYGRLADFEESGGVMYINRFDKLLYSLGGKNAVLVVWCALGAFYLFLLYRFFKVSRETQAQIAAAEARIEAKASAIAAAENTYQHAPKERVEPPLPAPPRLGDDPFRDPPAKPPIVVQKAEIAAAPTPRASTPAMPSDGGDSPKFLK
jgi:hypothetical protein